MIDEGPSLIFSAASRLGFPWYEPPFQLPLQHTMVKILIGGCFGFRVEI
jgi:hypothetical protein